ncbi:MAG: hypothetical protein SGBAC_006148 [Bacillariaceae sp.]
MSGRGRGRGRGRGAPPSGARLLLQRSAQEAGLGSSSLKTIQDITKPALFPDYEWHSSGRQLNQPPIITNSRAEQQKAASMNFLIRKSRDIQHRFQNSPSFVRPTQEVDINRYGKRQRPMEPDVYFISQIGRVADPLYFPPELFTKDMVFGGDDDGVATKKMTLEEMAQNELTQRRQAAANKEEDGDGDAEMEDDLNNQEEDNGEEEVDDYITNYYASDDEESADGGLAQEGKGDRAEAKKKSCKEGATTWANPASVSGNQGSSMTGLVKRSNKESSLGGSANNSGGVWASLCGWSD